MTTHFNYKDDNSIDFLQFLNFDHEEFERLKRSKEKDDGLKNCVVDSFS